MAESYSFDSPGSFKWSFFFPQVCDWIIFPDIGLNWTLSTSGYIAFPVNRKCYSICSHYWVFIIKILIGIIRNIIFFSPIIINRVIGPKIIFIYSVVNSCTYIAYAIDDKANRVFSFSSSKTWNLWPAISVRIISPEIFLVIVIISGSNISFIAVSL